MTLASAFRISALCVLPFALAWGGANAQSPAQAPTPTFRASVDLVQADVSVLDKNRRPVHGLTAADFVVREDGVLQTVDTFAAVDIPEAVAAPSAFLRKISPDVVSNELASHRIFAIVMDDATIENNIEAVKNSIAIANRVIDQLAPSDLATVIFTRDNRNTQGFTNDPAKLHAAVEKFSMGFRGMSNQPDMVMSIADPAADGLSYANSVHVLEEVVHYLVGAPDRRKALVYIGQGVPVDHTAGQPILVGRGYNPNIRWREMQLDLVEKMKNLFLQAQRSNVNVYAMDACGLRSPAIDRSVTTCQPGLEVEFLQTVARNTDGHATINTGNFEPSITQMFVENGSYYLLGYRRAKPRGTGQFTRLDVQVKRSGVTVRTRHVTYNEPTEDERAAKEHRVPASPAELAIGGVLPDRDVPLRATIAPFGLPSPTGRIVLDQPAALAIVLGVRERAPLARVTEHVELLTMAFTPEGDKRGAQTQTAQVALRPSGDPPDPAATAAYELLGRIDLVPGRYTVRLATFNGTTRDTGSVFIDVDVPDFVNAPVSLSGVVLESSSAPVSASAVALSSLIPVVPTTEREFPATATVRAFMRVYQGATSKLASLTVTTTISDATGAVVFTDPTTLDVSRFGTERAADINIELPLARLKPGQHVLTFEVSPTGSTGSMGSGGSMGSMGSTVLRRDVVFAIKNPEP
jgi:VWFA-related protein